LDRHCRTRRSSCRSERLAAAVQRDDTAVAADVDGALATLRADGTLVALGRRWLGTEEGGNGTEVVLS